jgi:mRNA interferase RelE/StbE
MAWTIRYTAIAAKAIQKFDAPTRKRVRLACEILARESERGKPLQLTLKGLRSWHTGDFRIVYRLNRETVEILVIAIGHRREIYDRLRDLVQEIPAAYGKR